MIRPFFFVFASLILTSLQGISANKKVEVKQYDERIDLLSEGKLVLSYHLKNVLPPKGVHEAYNKNGFIHPLNSPSGHALTGIHPKDHYHHTGIWHAGVKTVVGGYNPDFWNLKNIQLASQNKKAKSTPARVTVKKLKQVHDNGFTVILEQQAYLNGIEQAPTAILQDELTLRLHVSDHNYIIDYSVHQTNVHNTAIDYPVYRYGGGIAFRGPLFWNKDNSEYQTSSGLNRNNSHTSKAEWVAMYGVTSENQSQQHGLAILCHPKNTDAPQHIRTWDNGKVFFNYVPAQSKAFSIQPNQKHVMNYRIIAFNDPLDKDKIQKQYLDYIKD